MPTDRRSERSALRGLLVPDVTLVFDESQSTLTQAGPRAGLPEPDRRTTTALVATGEQADAFTVEVERGGALGGTLQRGGRVTYAHDGEDYGWDQPVAIRGWELVRTQGTTEAVRAICSVRDEVLLVAIAGTSGTSATVRIIRKAHGGAWGGVFTQAAVLDTSGGGSVQAAFVQLPSGRIILFYTYWSLTDGASIVQVFSDDDGVTWGARTTVALDTELPVNTPALSVTGYSDCLGMAAAYFDGDVSLFLSTRRAKVDMGSNVSRDGLIQFASSDLGQSFRLVDESDYTASSWNGGVLGSLIVSLQGQLVLTFISAASNPSIGKICRLGSAFTPFTDHGEEDLGSGLFCGATTAAPSSGVQMSDWDLCTCVMDDGRLWTYTRDGNITNPAFSENGGVDWDIIRDLDGAVATVYDGISSDSYLKNGKVCAYRHGIVFAHNWSADSGAFVDLGTSVAYLGGYANVVHGGAAPDRWSWLRNWVPLDLPNDVGWTAAGSGTATLNSGYLDIVTTGIQTKTYTESFTPVECVDVRASLSVQSGGVVSQTVYLRVACSDGGDRFIAEIRVGTAAVAVRDVTGAVTMGTLAIDTTTGVDIIVALRRGLISVWAAPRTLSGEVTYEAIVTDDLLTGFATVATADVEWGHGSAGESTWYEVQVANGDESAIATASLPGANISLSPVYTVFGTYIKAEGGPTWAGDSWTIAPRYDFGIDRVDPVTSPSPRRGWRSTTDADDCYLAFASEAAGEEHQWGGRLIAFGFFGVNWSVGEIQTRSVAGTWSTLFDFTAADPGLIQLAYARNGSTLVPTSSTGGNPFLRLNELAGSSIYLASGRVVRIVSNTSGRWSTATGAVRPTITIDASSLDAFTALSGTASLVPKDFVVITRAPSTAIMGVRLYIEGQDTAEGYFQIGTLVMGHVEVFADEYGWGRNIDLEPSVERTTLRGGSSRTRVLAPPKRRVTFAWEGGIDTTQIEGTEPEPDYVTSSSTASSPAVASMGHAPWQVFGLTSFLDSGRVPVVYLPQIPLGSTGVDTHTLNRREQLMLAQVVSNTPLETVVGDECDDEVIRISNVELEEVV